MPGSALCPEMQAMQDTHGGVETRAGCPGVGRAHRNLDPVVMLGKYPVHPTPNGSKDSVDRLGDFISMRLSATCSQPDKKKDLAFEPSP